MTFKLYYFFFCPFLQNISNYHLPNSYHHITISYYHTSISYRHFQYLLQYLFPLCPLLAFFHPLTSSISISDLLYLSILSMDYLLYCQWNKDLNLLCRNPECQNWDVYKSLMCTVYTWVSVLVGGGPGIILGHSILFIFYLKFIRQKKTDDILLHHLWISCLSSLLYTDEKTC